MQAIDRRQHFRRVIRPWQHSLVRDMLSKSLCALGRLKNAVNVCYSPGTFKLKVLLLLRVLKRRTSFVGSCSENFTQPGPLARTRWPRKEDNLFVGVLFMVS